MNTVYSNSNTDDDARREQLYSNQLRSTVPNTSGRTRFSIDFRTDHRDDVVARQETASVDSQRTGTTLRDFRRATDLQRIDEQIAVDYERAPASRP